MAKMIRVALVRPMSDALHQFRNFGEDVYRALREDTSVSIDEIDRASVEFFIRDVRSKFVRTATAAVRKVALKHGMSDLIVVEELEVP